MVSDGAARVAAALTEVESRLSRNADLRVTLNRLEEILRDLNKAHEQHVRDQNDYKERVSILLKEHAINPAAGDKPMKHIRVSRMQKDKDKKN